MIWVYVPMLGLRHGLFFSFFFHVLSPSYLPPLFDYDRFIFYLYSFLWILQTRFLYARLLKTHLMSCMYGYTCRFII
jgi:hypothetical protein